MDKFVYIVIFFKSGMENPQKVNMINNVMTNVC